MGVGDFRIQIAGAGCAAKVCVEPRGAARRSRVGLGRLLQMLCVAASFAVPTAFAASTTISALLDTDNNIATGCTIATVNGPFAGVERVLATKVVTTTAGYRIDSITLQTCVGSTLGAPSVIDSQSLPIAPGNGINGSSAVETYIPAQFLPNDGKKIRIGVTTLGADGLTGGDALTITSAGDAILVDGPTLMVVPTLAAASLLLTALLLAGSLLLARRRGWNGAQLAIVGVFALSLSGQLIAAVANIVRDGFVGDWAQILPAATDPVGDGQMGTDITAVFSTPTNGFLNLRVDVMLNSPPEATAQSVTAIVGQGLPITLAGTDFESSPLTFSIVTPPTQGVLTGTAPNLTYTPNPAATSSDSFTFKANDGALDSAPATVSITVTRAPAITSVDNTVFIPTQANTFTAFASNGMPTPTLSFGACSPALPSVTFVANGSGGGTLSGNPSIAEAGVHTCTLTATNGVLPNATQTFTVTVGGAPTITSVATLSVPELAPFSHTISTASVLPITGITSSGTLPVITSFAYAGAPASSATLAGTPSVCSRGSFPITFAATNLVGTGSQSFTLTVRPVNQVPSFTKGADVTVLEDATAQTFNGWATALSKGLIPCEGAQTLSFEITGNSNPTLFSVAPAVNGSNGDLSFTPAANANGSATITLRVKDDGGTADGGVDTSPTQSFTINVTPVNDAPSFTKGADITVLEDAGPQSVTGWATALSKGPADESAQVLNFIVSNNNNALFATQPAISATGELTFLTAPHGNGVATVTVQLQDNGGTANGGVDTSGAQIFTITVTPVNDAPSFTKGGDITVLEDSGANSFAGWATAINAGPNEGSQIVTINVTNNTNTALFSVAPAVATNGTLSFTPAANANGSATITLVAVDNGGTANSGVDTSPAQTFLITVTPVNDAPSFTNGGDITVLEDAGPQSVTGWATALSKGPADENAQVLNFIVSNSNNALFVTQPAISATGELTYLTAPHGNGVATVTVQLQDNGGTANGGVDTSGAQIFTITVTPVNDAPSFTKGNDVTVLEDSGVASIANWPVAINAGSNEAGQTVALSVTGNSNPGLFSVGPSFAANGTLSFTPAANANGSATISVVAVDNGGTASSGVDTSVAQTFVINVTAVNDVPSFTAGVNQTVLNTAGAQSVSSWASAISRGPANEAGQTVNFNITNNTRPALFSSLPSVDSGGTLTYTPVVGQSGVATITLNIQDNGGTANSGVDTSAAQSFTITVQKAPTISSAASHVFPITSPTATATVFTITTTGVPDVTSITLTACAPALPPEFVFSYVSGTTATITGTPTAAGNIVCTVTASNGISPDATQSLTLIPGTPPDATDDALQVLNGGTLTTNIITGNGVDVPGIPNGTVATFGGGSLGGSVASNPAGAIPVTLAGGSLTIATNGDLVLTNPNINGTYTFNYSLGNVVGADPALVTIIVGTLPTVTGAPAATATVGTAYSAVFTVAGSPIPTVSHTGSLPPGILRSGSTLSGTPNTPVGSPFNGAVVGTNLFGSSSLPSGGFGIAVSCDIITVGPATAALLGSPYVLNAAITPVNFTGTSSTSNPGGYTFSLNSGVLPTGLSLTSGQLQGTPTVGGSYTFEIKATHATSTCFGTQSYTVIVQKAVTAVADSVTATLPTPIAPVTFTDVTSGVNFISNDVPVGFPAGTIASFGTASATATAAGTSIALAGGTLTVNANGSWSLVNPTTPGVYTFLYRLSNTIPSTSDATVTLTLNKAPTISPISNSSFTIGTPGAGSFTVTGFPAPTLALSGCTLPLNLSLVGNDITGTAAIGATSVSGCIVTATNSTAPPASTAAFSITIVVPQAVINTGGASNTFTEDGPAVAVAPALTVTSAGTTTLASATVTLTTNYVNGQDSLSLVAVPAIGNIAAAAFVPATGVLSLSSAGATATLAEWETALRAVSFSNNSQNPSALSRTASFVVNNNFNNSAAATKVVVVLPVNDAPVITNTPLNPATEDILYSHTATATDVDGPPTPNWSLVAPTHTCGGAIGITSGIFTFTPLGPVPPASCVIAIQVCDTGSPVACSAVQSTTVTIIAVNDAPTANAVSVNALTGIPVTYAAGTLGGTDPEGTTVTINTGSAAALTNLQSVTLNADGSFTVAPTPGFVGAASFTYTVIDSGNPLPALSSVAAATVSITVAGSPTIFVKSSASPVGTCGNLGNECATLTAAQATIAATTGGTVFVSDAATYTAGIVLNLNGRLFGQGTGGANFASALGYTAAIGNLPAGTSFPTALPAINTTRPTLTSSAGDTVTLNSGNTLRGFNFGNASAGRALVSTVPTFGTLTLDTVSMNTTGRGVVLSSGTAAVTFDSLTAVGVSGQGAVDLTSVIGSFTVSAGAITATGGPGVSINGNIASVSVAANVSSSAGQRSVQVLNKTGGTVTFSGAITDFGTGISLTSNTGTTINFTGDITAVTGTSAAFTATGAGPSATSGGTISVTGATNTLTTTTGTALNIANTTIGASGLTFRSISSNGASSGIVLNNTGAGGFTVTGNGATCTIATPTCDGGSIQSSTGQGILLAKVGSVSLTRMKIQNSGTSGLGTPPVNVVPDVCLGACINGFTLDNSIVTDSAGGATDDGVVLTNVTGAVAITNSVIANSPHNGAKIDNFNYNMSSFTMTNSTISCASGQPCQPSGSLGNDGLLLTMRGTSVLPFGLVSGSTFSGVRAVGVQIHANDSGRIGVNSGTPGTFVLTTGNSFVVQNNTFTGNGQGIDMATSQVSNMTFQVLNNTIVGKLTVPNAIANTASSHAINAFTAAGNDTGTASHTFMGKIDGNIIGTQGVKDSGSGFGSGIRVVVQGNNTQGVVTVNNNTIREVPNAVIMNFFGQNGAGVSATQNANSARFKITNNNASVAPSGTNLGLCGPANTPCADFGVFILADELSPVCNVITGNQIYDIATFSPLTLPFGVYLAERAGPPVGAQLTVEGTVSVFTFVLTNNTIAGANKFLDESANTSLVAAGCGTFP